jgi:hypothetical protein
MREVRSIVLVAACAGAFAGLMTAPAYASDASVYTGYYRYSPRFDRQVKDLLPAARDFRQSRRPRRILSLIARLRKTVRLGINATRREIPSTAAGSQAKSLLIASLQDLDQGMLALQREVIAVVRGSRATAKRLARRYDRLVRRSAIRAYNGIKLLASAQQSSSSQPPSSSPPATSTPPSSPPPQQPQPQPGLQILPGITLPI